MSTLRQMKATLRGVVAAAALATSLSAFGAATIVINNINAPGVGFNDPTPVAPVGGNAGTTLGQQRLIAFAYAANLWGATLTSAVPIVVNAQFTALTCTATSAVLGSAGARFVFTDFPNAPMPATLYAQALANKLAGVNLNPGEADIGANFNVNLGQANCLAGSPFYLGLDNNHGTAVDLVAVLLHEFGHGLGFQTFTNGNTGVQLAGFPSVYDYYMYDNTTNKTWVQMTDIERATSARNARKVAWTGANVTAAVPSVLVLGTPQLSVSGPAAGLAAGAYSVGAAAFGPPLASPGVTADIMPVAEQGAGTGQGCLPFNALNTMAVRNNIALIDRGVCGFAVKAKNAQNAGAVGVIIANNAPGSPPPGLGGADPTIVIPTASVTQADGVLLRNALAFRSRTRSGVVGQMGVNLAQYAGADSLGRVLLFTPDPYQGGSSVSHWDTIAFRNLLMEPSINGDLTHSVVPPQDLTFPMFRDIGW